jgi:hypothetical protein
MSHKPRREIAGSNDELLRNNCKSAALCGVRTEHGIQRKWRDEGGGLSTEAHGTLFLHIKVQFLSFTICAPELGGEVTDV